MKEVSKKNYYKACTYYVSVFYIECFIVPSENAMRHAHGKYKLKEYPTLSMCSCGVLCLSTPVAGIRKSYLFVYTFSGVKCLEDTDYVNFLGLPSQSSTD